MAEIQLDSVTIDFPIYNASARSLKNSLLNRGTGGRIGRDAGNRVCVRALEDVSLKFDHGDRVALVGGNGAGKTTLLRVIAGVYEPAVGTVRRQGKVASLFSLTFGIDPESTGYENIARCGIYLGMTSRQMRERTEEIAAFSELGDYLSMPVRTYSTGMVLRLAFAVSTCMEPDVLLMDEWLSVGDAAFVEKAERRLQSLVGRAGILVLASHSLELLRRTCTKGVLLQSGRAVAFGPIDEIIHQYQNPIGP